ncbi:MAG: tRNA-2-methylthio-N(6)-dimethylallyladenosine synthase [Phycisphaerae bacterium]|nr:tRNA-2-methylthio-N(6)-dimethylallyladenosine synthase [Phycisphaerae bacterium]
MPEPTYYLETFGCQMNVLDSQLVEGQLVQRGMRRVDSFRDADIILFNTCSVRQHAEDKVLSRLGQLKTLKRRRPETIVGVIGCMAEREREGVFIKAPHVDLLCGPGELNRLPALIDEVRDRQEQVVALAGSLSRRTEVLQRALEYDSLEALDLSRAPVAGESELQSYIRVQRGCDKFCTYCVVPFTRGPERSRPAEHIVQEARLLAQRGCREVTLLGQTVNSYLSQEDGRPVCFAQLLERVHAVDGIDRVRFVTSFPADWDDDIFRVMRDCPKICTYLHIPAQSGSDRILKAMRRTYSTADYLRLMDTARRFVPDVSLAGDFIVGFCGETDADFAATIDLVRRVRYQNVFVFKYSPRPGTAADRNLDDDVPADVKLQRNHELLAVQHEVGLAQKQSLVGQTVEVLVEGYSKLARRLQESEQDRGTEVTQRPSRQLVGRTPGDQITVFNGDESLIGALARVRITSASALTLFGEVHALVSPRRTPPPPPPAGLTPLRVLGAEPSGAR